MNKTSLKKIRIHLRRVTSEFIFIFGWVFSISASAQTTDLLPNLIPLPASNVSLVTSSSGQVTLRFSTTSWNNGIGPLQLEAGDVDTGSGKQQVNQRIFLSDNSSFLHFAGWFQYHPEHDHIHFDDYALYTLQPDDAAGGSQRIGKKTTFCVMDTTEINTQLTDAPGQPFYSTCGQYIQGMSIGWGDTYGSHLAGQEIDFTDNADGVYRLTIEVDPKGVIVESNENDNVSCLLLSISNSAVSVLDNSGDCSVQPPVTPVSIDAIVPNQGSMGVVTNVHITGSGFTDGMQLRFNGGKGPRPNVSNVQRINDTEILAEITPPLKRRLSRDPVWDLEVGGSAVLRNAFEVIAAP